MLTDIILYAVTGFGVAAVLFIFLKFVFGKNVETINMQTHSLTDKAGEIKERVKRLNASGRSGQAADLILSSSKLNSSQKERLTQILAKAGNIESNVTGSGSDLLAKVKKLISENKKIEAIKLIKDSGVTSLKEAKDIADRIEEGN
ncbi:MAG: hypothetical protein IPM38_17440 [Ignavibacteria bacterium]|nr:hypothetical protein [Ignavibacteria bacterium]